MLLCLLATLSLDAHPVGWFVRVEASVGMMTAVMDGDPVTYFAPSPTLAIGRSSGDGAMFVELRNFSGSAGEGLRSSKYIFTCLCFGGTSFAMPADLWVTGTIGVAHAYESSYHDTFRGGAGQYLVPAFHLDVGKEAHFDKAQWGLGIVLGLTGGLLPRNGGGTGMIAFSAGVTVTYY